jgi:SAM-dependent methyltransferase
MPCYDRWAGLYAHHIVEHVWFDETQCFFRECHRVLRPGGTLRIVVPDAERFIRAYVSKEPMKDLAELLPESRLGGLRPYTPVGFISCAVHSGRMNTHRSAWYLETMSAALRREAGFSTVLSSRCNHARDPNLAGHDTPHWAPQSLYVEAVK